MLLTLKTHLKVNQHSLPKTLYRCQRVEVCLTSSIQYQTSLSPDQPSLQLRTHLSTPRSLSPNKSFKSIFSNLPPTSNYHRSNSIQADT